MKSKIVFLLAALSLTSAVFPALPVLAAVTTVVELFLQIQMIINVIIPFIVGLAVFVIIWGIFIYITKATEEEKRSEAKMYIVWGIVAVFCMLSIWGFVNVLVNSFNLPTQSPSSFPTVPIIQ